MLTSLFWHAGDKGFDNFNYVYSIVTKLLAQISGDNVGPCHGGSLCIAQRGRNFRGGAATLLAPDALRHTPHRLHLL